MKNKNVVIIVDFKLGNLFSVKHACINVGLEPIVSSDKKIICNANALILPGVGAFGVAMENLSKLDLINPIKDHVTNGKFLFGVCLGMQLLFSESEEYGINKGLNIIEGMVKKIPNINKGRNIKIPHIGWNTVYNNDPSSWKKSPLMSTSQNEFMYFDLESIKLILRKECRFIQAVSSDLRLYIY